MRFRPVAVLGLALAVPLALAACATPPVQGTGVVTQASGEPGGPAVLLIESQAGWPTPLATLTLSGGEVFRGKVIYERTEPEVGFGFGTGFGWGSRRHGFGYGSSVMWEGSERTSRAAALLISGEGRSVTCDIRTAYPGRVSAGGFADCRVSDGRIVAVPF